MKPTKTIKLAAPPPRTRAQIETLVADLAAAKNNERLLAAAMDAEILAIRAKYQPNLEALAARMSELTAAAQLWAAANPQEFGGMKSIEFTAGVLGFRTGSPKLKLLPKWTFDRVLEVLRCAGVWRDYIRVKEEVDKEALLNARFGEDELRRIGVQIVQEEIFYIAPRLTEAPARQVGERRAA